MDNASWHASTACELVYCSRTLVGTPVIAALCGVTQGSGTPVIAAPWGVTQGKTINELGHSLANAIVSTIVIETVTFHQTFA